MCKISVLDHGFIRLVDHMGNDLSVSRSARVSYDAEAREEDKGLIKYLMKNGHSTPFESVTFTFEVKAPIFVLRQWMRHRTQSYNELSARYRELPETFYIPDADKVGTQSKDNKQMRDITETPDYDRANYWCRIMQEQCEDSFSTYREMLADGVPREIARSILPLGTYSHMFTTMNLHNLFNFCRERSHEHAQYEIRVYSDAMLELIKDIVPISIGAYNDL